MPNRQWCTSKLINIDRWNNISYTPDLKLWNLKLYSVMQLQRFHKAKIITFINDSNNNDNESNYRKAKLIFKCNKNLKVFCDDFSYRSNLWKQSFSKSRLQLPIIEHSKHLPFTCYHYLYLLSALIFRLLLNCYPSQLVKYETGT